MIEIRKKQYEYYKERILINEIDKWDIVTISEVAIEIYSGSEVTKSQVGTGDYPAIRYSEIHSSEIFIEKHQNFVDPFLIRNKKYCEYGDLLVVKTSEDLFNLGKAVAYFGKKCILGSDIFLIKHKQNAKFLAYYMSTKNFKQQIRKMIPLGAVVHLRKSHLSEIKIPLPSIEEQERIVSILDELHRKVMKLESCVNSIIKERNKQCNVYSLNVFNSRLEQL